MLAHRLPVAEARRHLRALSLADARESVEIAGAELAARRAAREPRGVTGRPPRCKGCNRFVGGDPCRCGWVDGQGWAS